MISRCLFKECKEHAFATWDMKLVALFFFPCRISYQAGYSKYVVNVEQLVCRSKRNNYTLQLVLLLTIKNLNKVFDSFIHSFIQHKNKRITQVFCMSFERQNAVNDDILLANILTSCLMCALLLSNDNIQQLGNASGRSRISLRFASAFNCAFRSLE